MKRTLLALALFLISATASAQCTGVFPTNTVCGTTANGTPHAVPFASFTQSLTQYHFLIGNASNVAADTALGPDCTYGASGLICLRTNNILFGTFATQSTPTGTNNNCLQADSTGAVTGTGSACSSSGGTNIQAGNYTIATSDCGKLVVFTGTLSTITLPSPAGFSNGCAVTIINGNSTRGQKLSGFPDGTQGCSMGQGILWPKGSCEVVIYSSAWGTKRPQRKWMLSSTLNLFADSTNGNDSGGDCLALGAGACNTVSHAAQIFCSEILKNQQAVNITIPAATNQVENVTLCTYVTDEPLAQATAPVITNGVGITGGAIAPASGEAVISVNVSSPWTFNNIVFVTVNTSTTCIESDINSITYIGNAAFFTCGIAMQSLYNGKIELLGPITFKSAIQAVAATNAGGMFISSGFSITCAGIGSVSVWAQAQDNSYQNWVGTTFPGCGSVTGLKFGATNGGGIQTNSGGGAFFPGNVNGTPASPGWYN